MIMKYEKNKYKFKDNLITYKIKISSHKISRYKTFSFLYLTSYLLYILDKL